MRRSMLFVHLALMASCTDAVVTPSRPPPEHARERPVLTVELSGQWSEQRFALSSPLPRVIYPTEVKRSVSEVSAIEFEVPGPDAYVFSVVELNPQESTFVAVFEVPLWLERGGAIHIDRSAGLMTTDSVDQTWLRAWELVAPWRTEAEALAERGDVEELARLEQRTHDQLERMSATPELEQLVDVHRQGIFAPLVPRADRLATLRATLSIDDRRWALVSRQLPVLARVAGQDSAQALVAALASTNPSRSVQSYANAWLIEAAMLSGDSELARQHGRTLDELSPELVVGLDHPLALGAQVSLADSLGLEPRTRPVMVLLWSPWCSLCRPELVWWNLAFDRFADCLDFVSVSIEGTDQEVADYLTTSPMKGDEVRLDLAGQEMLDERWAIPGAPHVVLLSEDGHVMASSGRLRGPELLVTLDELLGCG